MFSAHNIFDISVDNYCIYILLIRDIQLVQQFHCMYVHNEQNSIQVYKSEE